MNVHWREGPETGHEAVSGWIGPQQPVYISLQGGQVLLVTRQLHGNDLEHGLVGYVRGAAPCKPVETDAVGRGCGFFNELIGIGHNKSSGRILQITERIIFSKRKRDQTQGGRLVPGGGACLHTGEKTVSRGSA